MQPVKVLIDRRNPLGDRVWVDGQALHASRIVIDDKLGDTHRVTITLPTNDLEIIQGDDSVAAQEVS